MKPDFTDIGLRREILDPFHHFLVKVTIKLILQQLILFEGNLHIKLENCCTHHLILETFNRYLKDLKE